MTLPTALENEFWKELKQFEQEQSMAYITTGERIGYERGMEVGEQKGEQRFILRLLQKRVGELPTETIASAQALSVTQLEELGEALLDFTKIEDLSLWLEANRPE